jgi:hypothetical protein
MSENDTDRCEWCRDAPGEAISGIAICDDCLDRYEIPPKMISGQMDEPVRITDGGSVESGTEHCSECEEKQALPELSYCEDCINDILPDRFRLPGDVREQAERLLDTEGDA